MALSRSWICPKCGKDFGEDFLRCSCGYEGAPIFSSRKNDFNCNEPENEYTNSPNQQLTNRDRDILAEEYLRNAELEYQRSKAKRIANERLYQKLQEKLEQIKQGRTKDPFEILGVHKTDSIETIHRAYRAIVSIYHPDKHGSATVESKKQKNNFLSSINEAYEKILALHNKNGPS